MYKLRKYQQDCYNNTLDYWANGGVSPLNVIPTGGGKTIVIAKLIEEFASCDKRVLCITDKSEILVQNFKAFHRLCPDIDKGVYCAKLKKREIGRDVVFASIHSLYSRIKNHMGFDLIIIDEAHLINGSKDTSMYMQLINTLKTKKQDLKICGFTATPYRMDMGLLYGNEDSIFDGVAYEIGISQLINDGFLCPLVPKGGIKKIDLSQVRHSRGDFNEHDLAKVASIPSLVKSVVREVVTYGQDRKSWLIFSSGINHANMLRNEFLQHNIPTELVTGDSDIDERTAKISGFKNKKIKCLINYGVLTTGFDYSELDLIALVRATESRSLYVQICGRGTRIAKGKRDCLFLDYGDNALRHGTVDSEYTPPHKKAKNGEKKIENRPKVKECPQCRLIIKGSDKICTGCKYIYPEPKINHNSTASEHHVLGNIKPTEKIIEVSHLIANPSFEVYSNANGEGIKVFFCGYAGGIMNKFTVFYSINHSNSKIASWQKSKFNENFGKYPTSINHAKSVGSSLNPINLIKLTQNDKGMYNIKEIEYN